MKHIKLQLLVTNYGALVYHHITVMLFNERCWRQRQLGLTLNPRAREVQGVRDGEGCSSRDKGNARKKVSGFSVLAFWLAEVTHSESDPCGEDVPRMGLFYFP